MLQCLDPEQRMVFVLGALFGVSDSVGAEVLDMSKDNFRQKLSRARHDLRNFIEHNCGLVDANNRCHCHRKTRALIERGVVDPQKLMFNAGFVQRLSELVPHRVREATDLYEEEILGVLRDQPFYEPEDYAARIREIFASPQFRFVYDL